MVGFWLGAVGFVRCTDFTKEAVELLDGSAVLALGSRQIADDKLEGIRLLAESLGNPRQDRSWGPGYPPRPGWLRLRGGEESGFQGGAALEHLLGGGESSGGDGLGAHTALL